VRTLPFHEEEDPEADEGKFWVVKELAERNFPPADELRKKPANTNILWSGLTQSGKSTGAAKLIYGVQFEMARMGHTVDNFLPSLKYHPAISHDITTAWKCHLSVSPLPFFKALKHDLKIMRTGSLEPRMLPPGSFHLLDEPVDVNNLEYWTVVAKVMNDFVTMFAFMGVNLIVLAPVQEKVLKALKNLCHLWIRQKRPGHSEVNTMVPWLPKKKNVRRTEFMQPIWRTNIDDEQNPPKEWMELYPMIKVYNADVKADENIALLEKKGYVI